jgi:ABC-type multidrug transport system permease subunit
VITVNQVAAVVEKTFKEFSRDKMQIFWTFAVPLFFLIVFPLMFYVDAPKETMSNLKGGLTVTMVTLLIMTAGQSNLPGSIASDKGQGLYLKMASMPIKPWKEAFGRVLAVWIFSSVGAILVLLFGLIYGAKLSCGLIETLESLGFVLITCFASVGIGLTIASFVKGESAATHTGVAITLLTCFVGGMVAPYSSLPALLQTFARIHPICSANASIVFLLEGEDFVGYNPLNTGQICFTMISALLIFIMGFALYSKRCWRKK